MHERKRNRGRTKEIDKRLDTAGFSDWLPCPVLAHPCRSVAGFLRRRTSR